MALNDIINKKGAALDKLLTAFDSEFNSYSMQARTAIAKFFRQGVFADGIIKSVMADFDEIAEGWAVRHQAVLRFSKDMAGELGISFAPTKRAIRDYALLRDNNVSKLTGINDFYVADIQKFGLQSEIGGASLKEITTGLEELFSTMGRRLNTEAFTGMWISDAVIKKDMFEEAGIDKYYYFGPNDNKTRDDCLATMQDPRQSTGWTMAEINASRTPFITRGGYNCRHEWVPFVEGI